MNEWRRQQLASKVRGRVSSTLTGAKWRALRTLSGAVLRLQDHPTVRLAWHAARTQQLLASLASHGHNITIQHPITVTGASAVSIGNDVSLAAYVHIWGEGGVTIANRVMIGTHTSITSLTHDYSQEVMRSTLISLPVSIGDDVWIGSNCVVLPGLHLGRGCVVGAGSVVTKDVLPFSIVSGVPARVIGSRPISQRAGADD